MKCENCNNEHDGIYGSGRFCSSKCARGFSTKHKRQEINQKVSQIFTKKYINNFIVKICPFCKKEFLVKPTRKNQICCSMHCDRQLRIDQLRAWGRITGKLSSSAKTRRSANEIYLSELCKNYFKEIKCNEPIFNSWDADIIIEDYKIAVLWNGVWHYKEVMKGHSLKQVQNRDKIKIKEIINCGYIPYIIKDMGTKNAKFVEAQFQLLLKFINAE